MVDEKSKEKAREIVSLRDREKAKQDTFRSLWQSVSDLMFPQTFGISHKLSAGTELMNHLFDTTAVEEIENMTSGLVNNLFPAGQQFFAIIPSAAKENYTVKRYVAMLAEETHQAIFNSNFVAQISNTIQYWITFGTGCFYSEFGARGLNFRDYAIGTYQCLEDSGGVIDTVILTCPMTARQIVQKFGGGKSDESLVGRSVSQAFSKPESREETFDVIQVVRPREDYDTNAYLRPQNRMPIESTYVLERDQIVLHEGGYDEFPFAVPRYQVIYRETYGRGRGTMLLPQVRVLNRLAKDYLDMSNKWVNPPKEVLESFEGQVDVTPGALNYVPEIPTVKAMDMGAHGVFPTTKDILEYYRDGVRQSLFKNAFEALANLRGDRRTTLEISERLKEGMRKLSKPLGRLFNELVTQSVLRSALLLIRNGAVAQPPTILQGTPLKIELINPLALALRDQQSRGFQYWVGIGQQMEQSFPGVTDNVAADEAFRDLGQALGVKTTHIRPVPERDAIREERRKATQAQEQAQLAQAAANVYNQGTKAPEEGSPAEALTGAA